MERYDSIQEIIRRARVQRSAYLGDLISTAIVRTWQFLKRAGTRVVGTLREKTSSNVFTFDS